MNMEDDDARCRSDQVQDCSAAVASKSLSTFSYGGECVSNEYAIYDQLCTLNHYTPGADYCCCAHGRKALCCRFHYDHKYFRCDEEADTINVPLSSSHGNGDQAHNPHGNDESALFHSSLTSSLIISGIVVAVVAIIVIIIVVRCVKGRRALNEGLCCETSSTGSSTDNKDPGQGSTQRHIVTPRTPPIRRDDVVSLERHSSLSPSAPPIEEDGVPELPPYQRSRSEPADLQPSPTPLHGPDHPMFRLDSEHPAVRQPLLSVPEAPPAYDDHHNDPRYHPEMDGASSSRAEWF